MQTLEMVARKKSGFDAFCEFDFFLCIQKTNFADLLEVETDPFERIAFVPRWLSDLTFVYW
ncbi:hypothetical protein A3K89_10625 [Rhodococcoides kyotonense]|uniref:Uncharacterized protein n=1 Tax=Rhodococcoides kyotonense TaxID=398843 RepID=A0A177Y898_9NOCA|nr:hypothetical protein A3K89_10625 [Rhodococcus kyotonensis]